MTHRPAPAPAIPAAVLCALLLLAGCMEPVQECRTVHAFGWDAPGLYEALGAGARWPVSNATAGPGLPAPDDEGFDRYGGARVSAVRYSDPGAPLRHATAHFGDPSTLARLVVTVPRDDDRPEPIFEALWDGLDFDADRDAVRETLLATRADTGHLVSYQAEVEPTPDLGAWLEARGGLEAAAEETQQLGAVDLEWEDWRMGLRVPWRAWTYNGEKAPYRLQAMPHGPAMLLVDTTLGWTPSDAAAWMRGHAEEHGLPAAGLDDVERAPVEEVCT